MDLGKLKKDNKFLLLALDHRGSFKKALSKENPDAVTDEQAITVKKEIIEAVKDQFSGVLIDATYGWPAYHEKEKPFLLPVEKSGYTDQTGERLAELEFNIPELIEMGASGAKLLLYFNPHLQSAKKQLETAKFVLDKCAAANLPLFLELRVYKTETGDDIPPSELAELVLSSVKMHLDANIIPDVFKLEYPGSEEACQQITKLLGSTPWIILTKGASFADFKDQYAQARRSGCQGFLAGRALWQEVLSLQGEEKQKFLKETLPARFQEIAAL